MLFVEKFMHVKMKSELDCTIDLAILRGPFEGWDHDKEISGDDIDNWDGKNAFYKFIRTNYPAQFARMAHYSRRNVSFSTVAPTGTVSLLTQTTSGLEPLFMPFYMRRKKVNKESERVDFVDEIGDKWQEFPVLHEKFKDWLESQINGNIDPHEREEIGVLFMLKNRID